jgi:hypothetical protein
VQFRTAESVNEDAGDAIVVAGVFPWYWLAHERDGEEDFARGDGRGDMAAVSRRVEERIESRLQLLHQVPGKIVVRGIAGVQGRGEAALGADESGEPIHPHREGFPWRLLGRERRRSCRAGIDFALHHGDDQVGPAREVPIEGSDADAGEVGDLLGRRVHAGVREHRFRSL